MTARWVVEQVAPARDLELRWQPISLLFKNRPDPASRYYAGAARSHRMLRIMEAVRKRHSEHDVYRWYWACGTRVHHDRTDDDTQPVDDLAAMLRELGLDEDLADAADDDATWDPEIQSRMDAGLELVGNDVGTPIIAFECHDKVRRGIFGPVITRVPTGDQALRMWDAMYDLTTMDGFWELKRTRTEHPDFGARPSAAN